MISNLGKNIRMRRAELGMSQKRLAEIVGISRTSLNDLERGRIKKGKPENIYKIANALEIPFEELDKATLEITKSISNNFRKDIMTESIYSLKKKPEEHKIQEDIKKYNEENMAKKRKPEFYNNDTSEGFRDFINDEDTMILINPTKEEINWLHKNVIFFPDDRPTKQTYIDLLITYRKMKNK